MVGLGSGVWIRKLTKQSYNILKQIRPFTPEAEQGSKLSHLRPGPGVPSLSGGGGSAVLLDTGL